jgi:N-sulfoglucosamine sulfohydrolase
MNWALAATAILRGVQCAVAERYEAPNVLLIVAEDMSTSIGPCGDHTVATPHLDQLASASTSSVFCNAYATSPNCSPSRSSILTGVYPHANGQLGLANAGWRIDDAIPTLPEVLRQRKYRSGVTYKIHVAPETRLRHSFDRFVEWSEVPATDTATLAQRMKEFVLSIGERRSWFWMFNLFDTHRSPNGQWIDRANERPRFDGAQLANLSAAFAFLGRDFASRRLLSDIALYYRAVERVDLAVRDAVQALREIGALDNTLVIFTADHGPAFTRAKLTLYERGLRVPLIVRWPAQWRAAAELGQRADLVSLADVFETIVALTAPPDEPPRPRASGGDWAACSLLTRATVARQAVYSVFYAHGRGCCEPSFMVRRGDMKLIYHPLAGVTLPNATHGCRGVVAPDNFRLGQVLPYQDDSHAHSLLRVAQAPPRFQLFNLSADEREFENLADVAAFKRTRNELFALLKAFFGAVPTMVATAEERAAFLRLVPNSRLPQCGIHYSPQEAMQ